MTANIFSLVRDILDQQRFGYAASVIGEQDLSDAELEIVTGYCNHYFQLYLDEHEPGLEMSFHDIFERQVIYEKAIRDIEKGTNRGVNSMRLHGGRSIREILDFRFLYFSRTFEEFEFSFVDFSFADLRESQWKGSYFHDCLFKKTNLVESRFDEPYFGGGEWDSANLASTIIKDGFFATTLNGCNFEKANFKKTEFLNTGGKRNNFSKSIWFDSSFYNEIELQSFTESDFTEATMNDTTFGEMNLRKTNFSGARLNGLLFSECNLIGAIFEKSNIQNCEIHRCLLQGSDFAKAKFDEGTSFLGSFYNTKTKFPKGSFAYQQMTMRDQEEENEGD